MPPNKKKTGDIARIIKEELGQQHLSMEIRDLIDAAVRKQWDIQTVTQRLANTHTFRKMFPGLIDKDGDIAFAISGQANQGVSPSSLGKAIGNYNTMLGGFEQEAKKAGIQFGKKQMAAAIKADTSVDEYKARLDAIDIVDSNPQALAAFNEQLKLQGKKGTTQDAYRAAASLGDTKFVDIYEASQYQTSLGLSAKEAADLAGTGPHSATIQSTDQIVQLARQNLQQLMPELSAQGINAASLVKALNNPTANPDVMDKVQQSLATRQGLFGRPQPGMYAQRGQGGGLSLYDQEQSAGYG